jgi:hypothetical protein
MADSSQPRLLPVVLIAAALTFLVTVVRLVGEWNGWDPQWFSTAAGSPLNPLGIVWLVPVFGFWFGRRAAKAHGRPPFLAAFGVPSFGLVALLGAAGYIGSQLEGQPLREALQYVVYGGPAVAVLALFAWPRVFLANLGYGILARLPVMLVQYLDIQQGWQTHFGKVHPKLPALSADDRLWLLTQAQATLWVPFTILLGGAAAAVGAASLRQK